MGVFLVSDDAALAAKDRRAGAKGDLEAENDAVRTLLRAHEQHGRSRQCLELAVEKLVDGVVFAHDANGYWLLRHAPRITLW